jgi:restriction system protein
MTESNRKVRAPLFPLYSEVRQLLAILDGVPKKNVISLIYAIRDQTGTPQNLVDWTDPDTMISERLEGENADLAQKIWHESDHTVNSRHVYGAYSFINAYNQSHLEQFHRISE